jgi:hypothetical protein
LQLAGAVGSAASPDWDPSSILVSASDETDGISLTIDDSSSTSYIDEGVGWAWPLYFSDGQNVNFGKNYTMSLHFNLQTVTAPGSSSNFWCMVGVGDATNPGSSGAGACVGWLYSGGGNPQLATQRIAPDFLNYSSAVADDHAATGIVSIHAGSNSASASRVFRMGASAVSSAGLADPATIDNVGYATSFNSDMSGNAYIYFACGRLSTGGGNITAKFNPLFQVSIGTSNLL